MRSLANGTAGTSLVKPWAVGPQTCGRTTRGRMVEEVQAANINQRGRPCGRSVRPFGIESWLSESASGRSWRTKVRPNSFSPLKAAYA